MKSPSTSTSSSSSSQSTSPSTSTPATGANDAPATADAKTENANRPSDSVKVEAPLDPHSPPEVIILAPQGEIKLTIGPDGKPTQIPSHVPNEPPCVRSLPSERTVQRRRERMPPYCQIILTPMFAAMSKITDRLFLTGVGGMTRENFSQNRISCVVNATLEAPNLVMPGLRTIRVPVDDTPDDDVFVYMNTVADQIASHIQTRPGNVVVHCVAGVSRSTSLVLGYLIKYHKMSLRDAYQMVHSRRPVVRPNNGFFRQLIEFEKRTLGTKSVSLVETTAEGIQITVPDFFLTDHRGFVLLEAMKERAKRDQRNVHDTQQPQAQAFCEAATTGGPVGGISSASPIKGGTIKQNVLEQYVCRQPPSEPKEPATSVKDDSGAGAEVALEKAPVDVSEKSKKVNKKSKDVGKDRKSPRSKRARVKTDAKMEVKSEVKPEVKPEEAVTPTTTGEEPSVKTVTAETVETATPKFDLKETSPANVPNDQSTTVLAAIPDIKLCPTKDRSKPGKIMKRKTKKEKLAKTEDPNLFTIKTTPATVTPATTQTVEKRSDLNVSSKEVKGKVLLKEIDATGKKETAAIVATAPALTLEVVPEPKAVVDATSREAKVKKDETSEKNRKKRSEKRKKLCSQPVSTIPTAESPSSPPPAVKESVKDEVKVELTLVLPPVPPPTTSTAGLKVRQKKSMKKGQKQATSSVPLSSKPQSPLKPKLPSLPSLPPTAPITTATAAAERVSSPPPSSSSAVKSQSKQPSSPIPTPTCKKEQLDTKSSESEPKPTSFQSKDASLSRELGTSRESPKSIPALKSDELKPTGCKVKAKDVASKSKDEKSSKDATLNDRPLNGSTDTSEESAKNQLVAVKSTIPVAKASKSSGLTQTPKSLNQAPKGSTPSGAKTKNNKKLKKSNEEDDNVKDKPEFESDESANGAMSDESPEEQTSK